MIKKLFDKTFLKFILVGLINTLVGTTVMFVLYNLLHCSYWVSSASNYVVGSVVSYFMNKYFTFKNPKKDWRIVVRFIVNISVCYLVAYGIAKPLVRALLSNATKTIQENGAMVVGMGLFVLLNYCGQRFFAFRKEEDPPTEEKD